MILTTIKKTLIKISLITTIACLLINSFGFILDKTTIPHLAIDYITLIGFVLGNFIIFLFLHFVFKNNGFRIHTFILKIIIFSLLIYPTYKFIDDYIEYFSKPINLILLLILVLSMLAFFVLTLKIKKPKSHQIAYARQFSKWYLISFGILVIFNVIITIIQRTDLTSLTELAFIFPYYFVYKMTLKDY